VRSLYSYEKPVESAAARAALTACFHRRFPSLGHVRLEHVWGGTTCLTMNGSPRWGRIDDNLYGSAGCNGSGVVKGTILGKRLAEHVVLGDDQSQLQAVYGQANRIAPEPFRTIGFHVVSAIERRKAGLEM
jgi:glycine/D-amino acid oxidase-like deaminating enzyme